MRGCVCEIDVSECIFDQPLSVCRLFTDCLPTSNMYGDHMAIVCRSSADHPLVSVGVHLIISYSYGNHSPRMIDRSYFKVVRCHLSWKLPKFVIFVSYPYDLACDIVLTINNTKIQVFVMMTPIVYIHVWNTGFYSLYADIEQSYIHIWH